LRRAIDNRLPSVAENSALDMIRRVYSDREPPGSDTWSPLGSDLELYHRARLLIEVCRALRKIPKSVETITALDVGCGVGRSSRLLLDLGLLPENILGVDLRDCAIDFARRTNPAIPFRVMQTFDSWPKETFDLCVQCTVFSSIPGNVLRERTAIAMEQSVGTLGYILWWDILRANEFAGGDTLNPSNFFPSRPILYSRKVALQGETSETIRHLKGFGPVLSSMLRVFGHKPSHIITLFGPKC